MCRPWSTVSSPVLTTAVMSVGRDDAHQAAEEAGGADSSGEGGDHGARLTVRARYRPGAPVCKARPVPAERATSTASACRVAVDATPLLGTRPGSAGSARAPSGPRRTARARRGRLRRHLAPPPAACPARARRVSRVAPAGHAGPPAAPGLGASARPGRRVVRRADRRGPRDQLRRPPDPARRPGRDRPRPHRRCAFPSCATAPRSAFPRLVRRAVADGAWVHTPSRFVADEVVAEFGVDPGRVRVVYHGVAVLPDPGRAVRPGASPASRRPCRPARRGRRRYVLAVGTVEPRKDYPGLVRAFERRRRRPTPTSPW